MISYDRVLSALRHKEADRVPFDLGGTVLTGMNIHCYKALRQFLGLPVKPVDFADITQQLARIEDDVIDLLKVDVRGVDPSPPYVRPAYKPPVMDEEGKYYIMSDEFGIGWKMPVQGGHYFDMVRHPLADADEVEAIDSYTIPSGRDPGWFRTMKERADRYRYDEQRAYVLGRNAAGIWELALWTSGFEKFFCDMCIEKEFAHKLMRKFTEYKMAYWEEALKTVGKNVLIVSEADDLATQNSLLCSVDLYMEMVHPYHKELYAFIRRQAKINGVGELYIFYHTCGAMLPFAELLREEGVDILNPVQVSAKGMDSKVLKKEIGEMFTFWGGGVDTQAVLPGGTPMEVRDEVKRRIDDLAPGGGFVFAAVHNVQSDVPPENYMAMWEALQEYGVYK